MAYGDENKDKDIGLYVVIARFIQDIYLSLNQLHCLENFKLKYF